MSIRETIETALGNVLRELGIEAEEGVVLEYPAEMIYGDYATGVALKYAKIAKKSPRDLAQEIVSKLGTIDGVAKIEIAGPGFINFTLALSTIAQTLDSARGSQWGRGETLFGTTIMVEYTDPNPFKEFHIGHLMSNAIGESIARLLESSGAKVIRANYQGDVGPHVAKALYVLLEREITKATIADISAAYVEGSKRYEENPEAKAAIDALNKKIYGRSDEQVNQLYEKGRQTSLDHFEELYKLLGTRFDFYFFESETAPKGEAIVRAHIDDGIFEESDGAIVFKGEKYGLHTRVFITSQGLPTYETKEIGLAQMKSEAISFDRSLTITASEQTDYFRVVTKAIELTLPELAGKIEHRAHGMMRFAEGKMSSRKGNVVTGESLIEDLTEEAKKRAAESRADDHEKLAQEIGVAAIKYQILKQASGKDIIFDRERALSLDGDSGPYLQYAYARTLSLIGKAKDAGVETKADANAESPDVPRLIVRFPEVVAYAASEMEPHLLTNYLLALAAAFNSWYGRAQILDGSSAQSHHMAIVEAVSQTLQKGLTLLAIPTPEKM
ncbi:MAG TPA: arginine--tRNA ligase [Candidatus Paceibacterota bacterium]|nr:arginine--tRNA ligase [Candidatus Paceibacterota bacterium]